MRLALNATRELENILSAECEERVETVRSDG